jgi:hypothetical protein
MGLFSGRRPELRYNGFTAQFSNPPIPPNSAGASYMTALNPARAETSMQKLAVWAAVMLIANLAAELPIGVFTGDPAASEWARPVKAPGYFEDIGGDGYGTPDWVFAALVSYLLRGNVYGKTVERDTRGGFPTQVPLYHPDLVRGWRDDNGRPTWRVNGLEVPTSGTAGRTSSPGRCWACPRWRTTRARSVSAWPRSSSGSSSSRTAPTRPGCCRTRRRTSTGRRRRRPRNGSSPR